MSKFITFILFFSSAVVVLQFQNCTKTRTVATTSQGSTGGPTATPTPLNTNPPTICDTAIFEGPEWTGIWGKKIASTKVPNTRACTTSGASVALVEPASIGTINAVNVFAAGQMSRPRFGGKKRQGDVSFLITDGAFGKWSSTSALSAYDGDSGSRIGATVTRDTIYVEFNDSKCASQKLFQGIPILGGLKANNWYRLFSQVKDLGNNNLEVKVSISDLTGGVQMVQTAYTSTCVPQWYYGSKNSWAFAVSAQSTDSGTPAFEAHINDFSGVVEQ